MKADVAELLKRLPGNVSEAWPQGERFVQALSHGSMSVELYAPMDQDPQSPHEQDELYIVHAGHGEFVLEGECHPFEAGTVFFVPAGAAHHFEKFSADFRTWVVFWGPKGGEKT
jgi:mannose-6-phosphate isomerase-like protein (cupin superfamily)